MEKKKKTTKKQLSEDDKKDLDSAIIEIVYKNVQENMYDYLEEKKSVSANSKLEELVKTYQRKEGQLQEESNV